MTQESGPENKDHDPFKLEVGDRVLINETEEIEWDWDFIREVVSKSVGEKADSYMENRVDGGTGVVIQKIEIPHGYYEGRHNKSEQDKPLADQDFHPAHLYLVKQKNHDGEFVAIYNEHELSKVRPTDY